jgi:hypothetical protein
VNQTKRTGLPGFLQGSFALQRQDFWQGPAIVLAVYAVMQVIMLVIYAFSHEETVLGLGLPTLFALACAALMNLLQAAGRFSNEFRMGLHMSATRRQMMLSGVVLSFANAVEMVLLAAGLQALWTALFGAPGAENILAAFPLWGWAAAIYVPVAMGILAGGILLRFGRIGFWVLYGCFMLFCFGPQFLNTEAMEPSLTQLLAVLPTMLPVGAVACTVAGTVMLWRVPIGE